MGRKDFKQRCEQYLAEYRALCLKHGMNIVACGCCDSPWVADLGYTSIDPGLPDAQVLDVEIAHLREHSCATSADDD